MSANDPFQGLLNDLLKLLGGQAAGSGAWLDAARTLAHNVATDGQQEGNADPLVRMGFEDLARVAELHVAEATGLGAAAPVITPVGRGAYALRALDGWAPILERMVEAQRSGPSGGGPTGTRSPAGTGDDGFDDGPGGAGFEELIGRFAVTMGPVLMGMQFGSAAGHLAQRAIGQYASMLPWPASGELLVVPDNVARFCEEWSLPVDDTRLWVCVHELTAHAVLSRPHVAERIRELVEAGTTDTVATQQGLVERFGGGGDPEALQRLLSDPESLMADLLTPGQQRTSADLVALTTAVWGYVEHVTRAVAGGLTTTTPTIAEAWYRYATEEGSAEQAAAGLFGLDLTRHQLDRGRAFVQGVVERAGEDGLARLWSGRRTLPTPAELDAPGLWLERIDLPDPDDEGPDAP